MTKSLATQQTIENLVGRYFHTTERCEHDARIPVWQGRVIAALPGDHLLIETFEWVMGEASGQQAIGFSDFIARDPIFYDDAHDMRFSVSHGRLSHKC